MTTGMWWQGGISILSFFAILIVYVLYGIKSGRFEYKRFLARTEEEKTHGRTPIRAQEWLYYDEKSFIRGVIFFNEAHSFHFNKKRAYRRAVQRFGLLSHCVVPKHMQDARILSSLNGK